MLPRNPLTLTPCTETQVAEAEHPLPRTPIPAHLLIFFITIILFSLPGLQEPAAAPGCLGDEFSFQCCRFQSRAESAASRVPAELQPPGRRSLPGMCGAGVGKRFYFN